MSHARLYLSTEGLPVPVPATDARSIRYSAGWWTVRAARTRIGDATVYVELERERNGCPSIVRHPDAMKRAVQNDPGPIIVFRAGEVVEC